MGNRYEDLIDIDTDIKRETARMMEIFNTPYAYRVEDDFFKFTEGDWTITPVELGTGNAAEAIADAAGGVLLITNDDAEDDSVEMQLVGESIILAAGKPVVFLARIKVDDAAESDLFVGLSETDTDIPAGTNNGVLFQNDDGDVNLDFGCRAAAAGSLLDTGVDLADDTWIVVGFRYDGYGTVTPFYSTDATGKNVTELTAVTTNIPTTEMRISLGVRNGEAAIKNLSVDYYKCAGVR